MIRRVALSLLIVLIAVSVVADKKKGKGSGTLPTISTTTITASEGSTAMAIRGIVEPGEGAVVIGFKDGVAVARDRISGRTFKFNVAAAEVGDPVSASITKAGLHNAKACCSISAINGNLLTVTEPAVGRTFQLQAAGNFQVGQAVDANFKAGTASIGSWSGSITNLSAATGLKP